MTTPNKFQPFIDRGLTQYILPCIPPAATLSPNSKIPLENLGKVPGHYNAHTGLWSGFSNWSNHVTTFEDLEQWTPLPTDSICLLTGRLIGADIDIDDPVFAKEISDRFSMMLGDTATRSRDNSPRVVRAYKLIDPDPLQKKRSMDFIGGGKIEILGQGQQFVACGPHKSGGMQTFTGDIIEISLIELNQFWEYLKTTYADKILKINEGGDSFTGERRGGEVAYEATDEATIEQVRQYIDFIPGAGEGERDDTCYKIVTAVRQKYGITAEKCAELLVSWGERCDPPFPLSEIQIKINSAYGGSAQGAQGELNVNGIFDKPTEPLPNYVKSEPPEPIITPQPEETPIAPVIECEGYLKNFHEISLLVDRGNMRNAQEFLNQFYYGGQYLVMINKSMAGWNGKYWENIEPALVESQIAIVFSEAEGMSSNKITAIYTQVKRLSNMQGSKVKTPAASHIPCNNGIFDMETGEVLPYNYEYFYTYANPFDYDPNATCPILDELIKDYAQNEEGWERQLDQMMGYILACGPNTEEKVMYLDGPPRSGKTLIAQAVCNILGAKVLHGHIHEIADNKILVNLMDKHVFYDDDAQTPEGRHQRAVAGMFKKIASGADMDVMQLYTANLKSGRLDPKFLLLGNGVAIIKDHSGGTLQRLLIHKFSKTYVGVEDKTLKHRIKAEYPGIINRFYRGYHDYKTNGFVQCDSSLQSFEDERESVQPFMEFFNENYEFVEDGVTKSVKIHDECIQWLKDNEFNQAKLGKGKLKSIIKQTLESRGVIYKHTYRVNNSNTSAYVGIKSKEVVLPEVSFDDCQVNNPPAPVL